MSTLARLAFAAAISMAPMLHASAQTHATEEAGKTRVVLQVSEDDPKKWNLILNNARNIQKDLGKNNVDIEIVAFGPGIGIFKADSAVAARVSEVASDGLVLAACENTMAAMKLTKEDMNPAAGYVPSGVVEIIRKEKAGYAYLRP